MELAFPWPTTNGEWLAWTAAALTALWGLVHLIAPRLALRAAGLSTLPDRPAALAHARGPMAGFYLGLGLSALLLAQPLLHMTLGFAWAFSAFGRLIGMLSDGAGVRNLALFVLEVLLAALPLAFVFGFVP
ncbi:MAG TPA: DUF4345 domain-containing protein [Mesorhizobium sp.]|jgi:hypothetical protein|nr:DUF4345 domain-containing protein [Mesorhizobium sp.]